MPDSPQTIKGVQVATKKKPRKYATHSHRWRKIRMAQLRRDPLCRHCLDKGITTAGNTVDHIDGDSWNNQPDNLQTLCVRCHTIKTNKHDGGFGHKVDRA